MVRILLLLALFYSISPLKTYAETLTFNSNLSKINYTLSYLGIPVKKRFLPVCGSLDIEKINQKKDNPCKDYLLKRLNLKATFISKNKFFRKTIDCDRYPFFTFFASLNKPQEIKNQLISIEGILSFHNVDKKITIKLKNNPKGNSMCLIGFLNIKMSDFGIKPPGFLFFKLDDLIRARVEVHLDV